MGRRITGVRKIPKSRAISVTTCWNRVIPKKKTKKQIKEEEKRILRLVVERRQREREIEERERIAQEQTSSSLTHNAAAASEQETHNTHAAANDNDATMVCTQAVDIEQSSNDDFLHFNESIDCDHPSTEEIPPVNLISYLHDQQELEWANQIQIYGTEQTKRQKESSIKRKADAIRHADWWDSLEQQVRTAYENYNATASEGMSQPPPGNFDIAAAELNDLQNCRCSPVCGAEIKLICMASNLNIT